ncbi:histone-lysine N-methyltransferase trithorax [Euwallacea similis]|uniref:histone-lysine N-methyltransferase trithorax n=1 Tax=Euwallacea similis TaxID=1736056 RepID=UPI00344DC30B
MGRSKFPGRPSKHCHKKRVNVLPPAGEATREGESSAVTIIGASKENKQDEDLSENEGESTSETHKAKPLRRRLSRKISTTMRKTGHRRNFISKIRGKTALKNTRVSRNGLAKGHVRKDATNFTGKFVLPTRSVHSSRVIKPNKRFIDLNETLSIKKKGLAKGSLKQLEDKGSNSPECDTKDKLAFTNGHRVILRQARLKLPSQVSTQGPFTSNLHNGPGTIICGVCGVVRYYRFVKQARKFNIYSCESCRKFISKQIKRQNVGSGTSINVLICLTGQGTCSIERNQHWKMSKCAYRSHCPACWLKMCLKAYHLPQNLKENLTQLLPKNMRGIDFSFGNSMPPILWQRNAESPLTTTEVAQKQRPVRFKPLQKSQPSIPPVGSDVKRQKLDLKGPRVKHVCRSASIVLGQPQATFGDSSNDKKTNVSDLIEFSSDTVKTSDFNKVETSSVTDEDVTSTNSSSKSFPDKVLMVPKKEKIRSLPIPSKEGTPPLPSKGILLHHSEDLNFENRDKSGFSIMASKEVSISAICFLCGSAGQENLLICCICCEPYHTFCLEEYKSPISFENDWVCLRCASCHDCKTCDRSKISCPKCLKIYHIDCFTTKGDVNGPHLICKECTKCMDCGTPTAYNLSSFPGNLPLCLNCLDKKKVGKHCPICQHSFEDNSNMSKMLECCKCKKWVHADCEKLTSEQYDILKLLPDSSNFSCSQCMSGDSSSFRRSIHTEMYRNFLRVFRLLIKNKSARLILKKVGVKGLMRKYMLTKILDIDNNNFNRDVEKIYSFEESERLQQEPGSLETANNLLDIRHRLWEYDSVKKFNNDMQDALKLYDSEQLLLIYRNIFQSLFPWFGEVHETSESVAISHPPLEHVVHRPKNLLLEKNKYHDIRTCGLCQKAGDGLSNQESRLLYCGNNTWVHANCAYWSANVYEQVDNHLQNVTATITNSQSIHCASCDKFGASIQCHLCRSPKYHFMCARKAEFYFTRIKKACFCKKHSPLESEGVLRREEDFEVNRSLFIEQSQQSQCEPEKVTCMIGSLCVKNLGRIDPVVSDSSEAIVPSGFVCCKIFWSTKEPWKLVTYVVTTSIQNPNCTTLTVDRNFTVNHSLEQQCIEKAMKELNDWRHVYERNTEEVDSEDEEEKNGTQLLSPELTDTILEDLPHDILDGISVQDIFPNFSYDDMLSLDNSSSESINEKKSSEDEVSIGRPGKVPPLSLTVSCKVDSSMPIPKKRKSSKEPMLLLQLDGMFDDSSSECGSPTREQHFWGISEGTKNVVVNKKFKICDEGATSLLQLDGTFDDSASECSSPTGEHRLTWSISEEPVTCEKCQSTYRTQASYKRHLDSCEVLCTSESDSENMPEHELCEEPLVASHEVTSIQISETQSQPVLIQAFESYQSQVHTSVVNVLPEAPAVSAPTQQVSVQPPTITIQEPAPISISVPLCVGTSLVQPSIEFQQSQPLQTLPQVLVQRPQSRREQVVIQQIQSAPTQGFVPFVDAFGQTQQYVQLTPQVQPQLLQIRPDGNVIGILPSIQPTTVIVQQPQQLVLDSSGAFGWAQQPQPQIYYGFETIVQNTVMQSHQQFLPTPVPGVLAANSSYSTTTQVFQTSKLEPVLDVSSNSFVLVNSSSHVEMPQQFCQPQPTQTPALIYSSQPSSTQKAIAQNCVTLPNNTSFVPDQRVPMNVVPPRPKTVHSRPMSRVLPMPTNAVRPSKKIADATKIFPEAEKPPQIKLDDKLMFPKDLLKVIDSSKSKNRKFEILDYKIVKPKVAEKPFKEFEPAEKVPNLSTYEPLKEIEKVKRDLFEKSRKDLLEENNTFVKNMPVLETFHMRACSPKLNLVHRSEKLKADLNHQTDNSLRKFNNNFGLNIENSLPELEDNIHNTSPNCSPKMSQSYVSSESEFHSIKSTPPEMPFINSVAVPQDKPLDMPQLNVILSEEESNKEPDFNVKSPEKSCKFEPLINYPNRLVVPPLLPVKPQPQIQESPKELVEEKRLDIPERKQPSKKESELRASPSIVYTVENKEDGFKCSSTSISDCWSKVLEAVQAARAAHNMPPLPTDGKHIKSVQLTGLKSSHIKYLVEQLPGASKCVKYKPLYKFTPHPQDLEVCSHGFGAVRCQPHKSRNTDPFDVFSWLSSKHREPFEALESQAVQSRRVNSFPMAMKFKNLKLTSKYSVGVYRSRIHGKGLFCLRDIEPGEMVIEYAGEVIRSILTDKREKFYNSKGIGCYMFRVDDNFVVDATMKGNAARFINHSCDPNCYSKVVEIVGHKHIIIFALRRILSGEELTYDYKFPFEEDKIPCTCGARRCRKFLN